MSFESRRKISLQISHVRTTLVPDVSMEDLGPDIIQFNRSNIDYLHQQEEISTTPNTSYGIERLKA